MSATFDDRLSVSYSDLSATLQQAADFVRANPVDLATRTLRSVSRESGISPAAFSRLARALGYSDLAELREEVRKNIDNRVNNFAARAAKLQSEHRSGGSDFVDAHFEACQSNLHELVSTLDRAVLDVAITQIEKASRVVLLGALGSTGVVEYLSYIASFCADNWTMASRMGSSLGGGIAGLGNADVMIIVTKPPFAERSIAAAKLAQQQGVYVVLITDTLTCPALKHASARFIVPTQSPHFYSSYVVTLFLVECLIGVLVGRSGSSARRRIAEVEEANKVLAEVWDL